MSRCRGFLRVVWAAAAGEPRFLFYPRQKGAKSVDKSRLLAGKTVDYQQYSVVRAWRSDVYLQFFSMHGVTRAFPRAI